MATVSSEAAACQTDEYALPPFLRRIRIRGYKSIAFCDVRLQPLTILVGRNAAGKSNVLDALAFLRDVMKVGVTTAVNMKSRGGWSSIVCRSASIPKVEIGMETAFTCGRPFQLLRDKDGPLATLPKHERLPHELTGKTFTATYSLEFSIGPHSAPIISRESLEIADETNQLTGGFEVHNGIIQRWRSKPNSAQPFQLPHSAELLSVQRPDFPLLSVIGTQPFVDLGEGLRWMAFYNFHPDAIRTLSAPTPGSLLDKHGYNLASVIETTRECEPEVIERVGRYLSVIAEPVELIGPAKYGEFETVRFRVRRDGQPFEFDAASMSDGTLRTLAALVAAFQIVLPQGHASVVGIEEPETSLHPAALRALVDALDEATARTQILLTTQSADVLDNSTIRPQNIRVVQLINGETVIASVDEASVEIVRRNLNTLGGLERDNHLEPNLDDVERQQRLRQSRGESPA